MVEPARLGPAVARRRGTAKVKLAVILHGMWPSGTDFRFGTEAAA